MTACEAPDGPQPIIGYVLDEDRGFIRVSTQRLRELADPISVNPWTGFPLTVQGVIDAMGSPAPHPDRETCAAESAAPWVECDACEIRRIAHFVEHGWPPPGEDVHPVTVDVGLGSYWPGWLITDGNHRVAAAIVAGHEWVDVEVGGSWERAVAMLVEGEDGADVY